MKNEFIEFELEGAGAPVFFMHGFGSTKEDYAGAAISAHFAGRRLIAFDAPGCGETEVSDLSALSIPFLQQAAVQVLAHYGVERFHLVGHSMGGLAALLLAEGNASVRSFSNIEGNISPEDCFLSCQITKYPSNDPEVFLKGFAARAWEGQPLFASTLAHKVRAGAVAPIFNSMVALSDSAPLMEVFTGLDCSKTFVYGDENRGLSYLGGLMRQGVQLAEIAHSGHWPMYSNPPALWAQLGAFMALAEGKANG